MKLKDLFNNETFISEYGDYETVGNSYTALRENDKLRLVFDIQEPKPKSVWDLDYEDDYVRITGTGGISECEVCTKLTYERQRDVGNVFLTEEEAEKEVERRQVETLLLKHGGRRWFKNGYDNYYLDYDSNSDLLDCSCAYFIAEQGAIYFDSWFDVKKAISEIGEERIKRALFEVR